MSSDHDRSATVTAGPLVVTPILYHVQIERLASLVLGLKGERVEFCWRPYAMRSPDHQADYDRLLVSIFHGGIRCPLITWEHHVLIGMRRAEIGQRVGIETVTCWRILEDVRQWHGSDLPRLEALKAACDTVSY